MPREPRPRTYEQKSIDLQIASDIGRAANDFGGLRIACATNHNFEPLPADYNGQYVWFINPHATATIMVAQSLRQTAEVSVGAAGSNNPATKLLIGTPIPPRTAMRLTLDEWDPSVTCYLIHEASEAADLTLQKGS
jgi:hypothetical protein